MPRTAVTVAKTHKGDWKLLAHPDVPLPDQNQLFKSFLGKKSHEQFAYVQIQESDGLKRHINLLTPADGKKHEERRASELLKAIEAGKLEKEAAEKREALIAESLAKEHADTIEALNKLSEKKPSGPPPRRPPAPGNAETDSAPQTSQQPPSGEGPTFEDWIKEGLKPENYPPTGFQAKDTPGWQEYQKSKQAGGPPAPPAQ